MYKRVKINVKRVNNPLIKNHHKKFIIESIDLIENKHCGIKFDDTWEKSEIETWKRADIDEVKKSLFFIFDNRDGKVKIISVENLKLLGSFHEYFIKVGEIVTDKEIRAIERLISIKYECEDIVNGV